jgi:membrane protein
MSFLPAPLRRLFGFLGAIATAWSDDHCSRKAAALAYYTAFSLAPTLVIVVWLVSFFVDATLATEELRNQLSGLVGSAGAEVIDAVLKHTQEEAQGLRAIAIAFPVLLIGATTAFSELKESLDEIWGVRSEARSGIWGLLRTRLLSFGMILVIAFLLLVSLAVNAMIALASTSISRAIGVEGAVAVQVLSTAVALVVVAGIFAAIYKLLPAISLRWRDVARAAGVTTVLFLAGQTAIGLYLGNSATASAYGAAGSLAVLLLWIYYSSAIFLLGAELNKFWLDPIREASAHDENTPADTTQSPVDAK